MTSVSSSNGTLSSTGIGSGLDVSSIITQLMAAESQPLKLLQNQASDINTQISSVGQIQSLASALNDKARALQSSSLWTGVTATSSDSTVVSGDTSAGGATAGNYQVTVQALASSQTVTSSTAAASTMNAGTLTIQLGTWTGSPVSGFQDKAGSAAVTIDIGSGDTSLTAIRDKINAANAGVQASVINDATGARLSIRSTATGAENGFRITAQETVDDGDPTTGLSALSYDALGTSQLALNQSAGNAKATINGIAIESATNTMTNVSDGLNITVSKVSTTPVNLALTTNTGAMTTAINGFVSAYNALNSYIHDQTKYDPTAKTGGPLQGDPSIIGFQNQMRSIATGTTTASSVFTRLGDLGISLQADGSLATDSTKLSAALTNPGEVQKLFASQGLGGTGQGVAVAFGSALDSALTVGGRLASRKTGLTDQLSRNSDNQAEAQTRLDAEQARYQAQFQALDTTMAKMNALSTYMTQQITLMNKSG